MRIAKEQRKKAVGVVRMLALLVLLLPVSCINDNYDEKPTADSSEEAIRVELSIQTRASTDETEVGTTWENYIDIASGDFRIYFFTYDPTEKTAGNGKNSTVIAELKPTEIYPEEGYDYTMYTLIGEIGEDVASYENFKIVVLANWGNYPSVTAGTTTIDDLVEGNNTFFNGRTLLRTGSVVDADNLIPFYGVREYSGVDWKNGWKTTLSGAISLLRAFVKVEVVLTEDSSIDSFSTVSIVRCNRYGYRAPKGVYLRSDYDYNDPDYTIAPALHLSEGKNDTDAADALYSFRQLTDAETDTWIAYMAEYDNTSDADDYSYIQVRIGGNENYNIYFANYEDGSTTAYDTGGNMEDRYDLKRNNLYRFNVTYKVEEEHEFYVALTVINDETYEQDDDTEGYFDNESHFE